MNAKNKKVWLVAGGISFAVFSSACSAKSVTQQSWDETVQLETFSESDEIGISEKTQDTVSDNDLVYREYSIGSPLESGTIFFEIDEICRLVENPQSIAVYFNDEFIETLPIGEADVEYEIKTAGYYGFFIIDENDQLTEISGNKVGKSDDEKVKQMN